MTFNLEQGTDCDIDSAHNLCRSFFERNGYLVETKGNRSHFQRRAISIYFNRVTPIVDLIRGFGEGNIFIRKQNDNLAIKVKHKWIMHGFTSIILLSSFTFIFYLMSQQGFNLFQPLLAFLIVAPISVRGYFKAKNELQNIFNGLFKVIKKDFKIIE